MADAHCTKCEGPIAAGAECPTCAGVAATQLASAPPTKRSGRAKTDPLIGAEVIGQYVIRSLLGTGGMGAVYLADQQSVGRRAVIKVLHPHARDADSKARFETEARAASQLNHPNIVTIYNYGAMTDGTLFLAMEFLDGQTLEQVAAAKRRIPLDRAINIVTQIADALGEAHRNGVVHRDVKPSNVMLVSRAQADDVVKVLDFGIARVDGTRLTETGAAPGTPTYMSPEQIRNKTIDGRSDLYSLGCILFELVTGRVPFTSPNALGLAYMHVHEEAPRAIAVAPKAGIAPALDAFIARALAKEPTDRPRNADAFRDELRAAVAAPEPTAVPAALARVESKPAKAETSKPRAKPTPARGTQSGTAIHRGFAAIATAVKGSGSLFRRRKSFGQRLMARVRSIGRRPSKRWAWFVVPVIALTLVVGVGWYVMTQLDRKSSVAAPAKVAPVKEPAKTPAKPARAKRPAAGSGSRPAR